MSVMATVLMTVAVMSIGLIPVLADAATWPQRLVQLLVLTTVGIGVFGLIARSLKMQELGWTLRR